MRKEELVKTPCEGDKGEIYVYNRNNNITIIHSGKLE